MHNILLDMTLLDPALQSWGGGAPKDSSCSLECHCLAVTVQYWESSTSHKLEPSFRIGGGTNTYKWISQYSRNGSVEYSH